MNTQQMVPPGQQQQQQKKFPQRFLLFMFGVFLILIGFVSSGYMLMLGSGGSLTVLIFMVIPCMAGGIILIMLSMFSQRSSAQRYWPGTIACIFTALTLVAHTLGSLPLDIQDAFPLSIRIPAFLLYIAGPILGLASAGVALYITRTVSWFQGRLLAHLAFWLSLLLLLHLCMQMGSLLPG